jgi:hypothetical protein
VRQAYIRKGWSFNDPVGIEQCVEEGWIDKVKEQNQEGCRIAGRVRVNKVVGNLQFSPGRSFQNNMLQMQELVPYLRDSNHHDFGHYVNRFRFASDMDEFYDPAMLGKEARTRTSLGIKDPLTGTKAHTEESDYMFQCESGSGELTRLFKGRLDGI